MYKHNIFNLSAGAPYLKVENIIDNTNSLIEFLDENKDSFLTATPYLYLISKDAYNSFSNISVYSDILESLLKIIKTTKNKNVFTITTLFNIENIKFIATAVAYENKIIGIVPQDEYRSDYKKYFTSNINLDKITIDENIIPLGDMIFSFNDLNIAVVQGYDSLNKFEKITKYSKNGANLILDISSQSFDGLLCDYLKNKSATISKMLDLAYLLVNPSIHDSTSKNINNGALSFSKLGSIEDFNIIPIDDLGLENNMLGLEKIIFDLDEVLSERFKKGLKYGNDILKIKNKIVESSDISLESFLKFPFLANLSDYSMQSISFAQINAISKKFASLKKIKKAVIGVSGGLDSTLTLLSTCLAFDDLGYKRKNIIGMILPSKNTSAESLDNANLLCDLLGVSKRVIEIDDILSLSLDKIKNTSKNTTYENAQARIRMEILTNTANKENAILMGTSDLSEIMLGYFTFAGDQISHYSTNSYIPKTMVKVLVANYARYFDDPSIEEVIEEIVFKPISAELLENQDTEKIIGKYEINDFIMYHYIKSKWSKEKIIYVIRKIFLLSLVEATNYFDNFIKRFNKNQFKLKGIASGANIFSESFPYIEDIMMLPDNEK